MNFYDKFPNFDWKFYISIYTDIQKAGIDNKNKAINHYLTFGIKEKRRTHKVISSKQNISKIPFENFILITKQCYFSSGVETFKPRIFKKYNLKDFSDINSPCLFFGMYNDTDLKRIKKHKGLKIIIWCGSDANNNITHSKQTIGEIKKISNIIHISKSMSTFSCLKKQNISSILVDYNIVDRLLFYPIPKTELGKNIFIFNGQHEGREQVYGKKYYLEVIKKLPQYNYIFSNTLNVKWTQMPGIYKKCFIMLRLTSCDGNANSVQECEAMGIPVIHNQSDYGLQWENVDDIVYHIKKKENF